MHGLAVHGLGVWLAVFAGCDDWAASIKLDPRWSGSGDESASFGWPEGGPTGGCWLEKKPAATAATTRELRLSCD